MPPASGQMMGSAPSGSWENYCVVKVVIMHYAM
jgi:hypothetical protein